MKSHITILHLLYGKVNQRPAGVFGRTRPAGARSAENEMQWTFSFSGQVRSLTYEVISKYPHGHKMWQLRNAANARQSFSEGWNFQKVTSPGVLTCCVSRIFHAGHLRSSQSHDLAHYKPMGKYRNCSFCNIYDKIRTQTHHVLLSYTTIMYPYLVFAFWT